MNMVHAKRLIAECIGQDTNYIALGATALLDDPDELHKPP